MTTKPRLFAIVMLASAAPAAHAAAPVAEAVRIELQSSDEFASATLIAATKPLNLSQLSLSMATALQSSFRSAGFRDKEPNGCFRLVDEDGKVYANWASFEFQGYRVRVILHQWIDASDSLVLTLDRYGGVIGDAVYTGESRIESPVRGSVAEVRDISECIALMQVKESLGATR